MTFHNVIIFIKSVVKKNKNDYYYYYNIVLGKGSHNYSCIISEISKNETINVLQNTVWTKKRGKLLNIKIYSHI